MESLEHYLFIDIETAGLKKVFSDLSPGLQDLWQDKARKKGYLTSDSPDWSLIFNEKAAVFSEFGRIVCIGLGCFIRRPEGLSFTIKSIADTDEKLLLNRFCKALDTFTKRIPKLVFCGHNIKEFDLPYISRRMIINDMKLPDCLRLQGKKPWEIPHLDTMELWSFGDRKNYTSLALLSEVLGIPSPKDDIDGSEVGRVFWEEQDLRRISTYCEKDVETTARIFLRLMEFGPLEFETTHL